jgi:hypothetical protein
MKIRHYSVGSDCELFLQDKQTGKIITAEGIIKGTKSFPFHFDENNKYYATSLDCVAAEFNIPPCTSEGDFYLAVQHAIRYINSTIPNNLQTLSIAEAILDEDQLQSETANTYGCASSYNCWTGEEVHPTPDGSNRRVIGKHIHIGYENPNKQTNIEIGKAMDLFIGVPSILKEPSNQRRSSGYGLAGNCRDQNHGLEWRVLSSYFSSSEELIKWCYRQTEKAIDFVNNDRVEDIENLGWDIQNCINQEDKELAKRLIKEFNIDLV